MLVFARRETKVSPSLAQSGFHRQVDQAKRQAVLSLSFQEERMVQNDWDGALAESLVAV
jgi:hypothetical protein